MSVHHWFIVHSFYFPGLIKWETLQKNEAHGERIERGNIKDTKTEEGINATFSE